MKKIFTLIAAVAMAASVNAQTTLIDYPTSQAGITVSGTTIVAEVKIHTNTDKASGIKFANGYTTEGVINANYAELSVEGGFKAGDKITIAGAFNTSDETKQAAVALFTGNVGESASVLYTTATFINGRLVADDPVEETYTLAEDADKLKLGRKGNTGAIVTKLTVVRSSSTGISSLNAVSSAKSTATYNLAGQQVSDSYKGIVIKNGKKYVK